MSELQTALNEIRELAEELDAYVGEPQELPQGAAQKG